VRFRGSVVTWAVVLMAAFSVLSMICLFLLDGMVHGDLYGYGLQFSYNWATPYWTVKNIAFALGWLSIFAAIVALYSMVFKRMEVEQLLLDAKKARARALKILKTEPKARGTDSARRDRERAQK